MTDPSDPIDPAGDAPTSLPPAGEPIRYADAMSELREILRGVEEESIDLDALSEKIERAAVLIRTCRARITETEMRVRRVLEDLDEG